tara:strand:- start:138 stop:878 length:741 start_codon:yes stop_codon:yes gene_type:complete
MFKEIIKTLPTYTLFIGEITNINITKKIKLRNVNNISSQIGICTINKYNYYYYYLYKKFGQDIARKLMINYIIKLHIKIPINFYYKLHTNYCYELFVNKIMLIKSQYNNKYRNYKMYNKEFDNDYTVVKISNIYKKMIHISKLNIIKEITYLDLDNLGINVILNDTKSDIEKFTMNTNKRKIKVQFDNYKFLNNQDELINILYKHACLCNDCINKRQDKQHIKISFKKFKENNTSDYWLDPLKHLC